MPSKDKAKRLAAEARNRVSPEALGRQKALAAKGATTAAVARQQLCAPAPVAAAPFLRQPEIDALADLLDSFTLVFDDLESLCEHEWSKTQVTQCFSRWVRIPIRDRIERLRSYGGAFARFGPAEVLSERRARADFKAYMQDVMEAIARLRREIPDHPPQRPVPEFYQPRKERPDDGWAPPSAGRPRVDVSSEDHKTLGLPVGADLAQIKTAYRRLALVHHPDKAGGSAEQFRKLNEAYCRLLAASLPT